MLIQAENLDKSFQEYLVKKIKERNDALKNNADVVPVVVGKQIQNESRLFLFNPLEAPRNYVVFYRLLSVDFRKFSKNILRSHLVGQILPKNIL